MDIVTHVCSPYDDDDSLFIFLGVSRIGFRDSVCKVVASESHVLLSKALELFQTDDVRFDH